MFLTFLKLGFKDFAPTLTLKGQKIEGEDIKKVLEKFQKWQPDDHQMKVINVQTVDHHAYYRCARDSSGKMFNEFLAHYLKSFYDIVFCLCITMINVLRPVPDIVEILPSTLFSILHSRTGI